jgi:hypothetical protein
VNVLFSTSTFDRSFINPIFTLSVLCDSYHSFQNAARQCCSWSPDYTYIIALYTCHIDIRMRFANLSWLLPLVHTAVALDVDPKSTGMYLDVFLFQLRELTIVMNLRLNQEGGE